MWGALLSGEDEQNIIRERWAEIMEELIESLAAKEYRKRQSAALALSDLILRREWREIKPYYERLYVQAFSMAIDKKDTVKMAVFQLLKSLKKVTLDIANVYTNSRTEELTEVLTETFPIILEKGVVN